MSLLDSYAKTCTIMEKQRVSDGEGGWEVQWKDGAEFTNYYALDTSMMARLAEKDGVTSTYSVLVDSAVPIEELDYFRDNESGLTYRVTSRPEEKQAPKTASFSLKFFTAERKELPR